MLRPWLAAALLLVPLAGCAGGPEETGQPAAAPTSTSAAPLPELPVVLTDTLYLLGSPHLAGALPSGGETIRTYVPTDLDALDSGQIPPSPQWSLPRPDLAELDIQLRLWIEVTGVVTNPPRGPFNCFWSFSYFIEHADGTRTGLNSYCRSADPVLQEGVTLLEESFVQSPDLGFRPGDRLGFDVGTYGAYAPDAKVEILSGTPEHDSSLTVVGLQLPIETQTLLLT